MRSSRGNNPNCQRWSRGHKARGQGQGHKKIRGQGQGQPFRGQTPSRPRTGILEAKAKDQGHSRNCSQKKKKVFKKSFLGNHQFIGVARIFDWGGLNHKSHAMTSSKICLWALSQDFAKREGLNKYSWKEQIRYFGDVLKSQCNSNVSQTGGLEAGPPAAGGFGGLGAKHPAVGRFFVIFWKKKLF